MKDPQKYCLTCKKEMFRKRYNGRLEDLGVFKRRRYCTLSCSSTKMEVGYHGNSWRARQHLKTFCEICKTTENLHAHHCDQNRLNNTPENIQTLCSSCHISWHHKAKRLGVTPCGRAEFQEQLMGLPLGHTELKLSETE